MGRFRKRPIVIDAVQFIQGETIPEGVVECAPTIAELESYFDKGLNPAIGPNGKCLVIQTLEGPLFVSDGDWIITGVNGEKYPCKPDIFEKTYEPVTDSPSDTDPLAKFRLCVDQLHVIVDMMEREMSGAGFINTTDPTEA